MGGGGLVVGARAGVRGGGGGGGGGNELHALGAGPVVAVVEFQAFALQDECADAILGGKTSVCFRESWRNWETNPSGRRCT